MAKSYIKKIINYIVNLLFFYTKIASIIALTLGLATL